VYFCVCASSVSHRLRIEYIKKTHILTHTEDNANKLESFYRNNNKLLFDLECHVFILYNYLLTLFMLRISQSKGSLI
jgi:hypothetical protein